MKKLHFLLNFMAIIILALAGCGNSSDGAATEKSGDVEGTVTEDMEEENTGEISSADYEEIESLELEGPVTNRNFSLDEEGNTLLWGENDGGRGNELRRNVWTEGEITDLDIEIFSQPTILTSTGQVVTNKVDWDAEKDERHFIVEYDPATGSTEEFLAENERDDILLPGHGRYIQEPRTYIHTVTNTDLEDAETYIWDINGNEFIDLNLIEEMKGLVGEEFPSYPHYYLTEDLSTVYTYVMNTGIFAYDVASGELETLLESDNVMSVDRMLTIDERYMIYVVNNSESETVNTTYHALALETEESIEIGGGDEVIPLANGHLAIIDEFEVKFFDFDTETLETFHTIELNENQDLDNVTVSLDGSTIAYAYTTDGEDDEEDTSNISILSNK